MDLVFMGEILHLTESPWFCKSTFLVLERGNKEKRTVSTADFNHVVFLQESTHIHHLGIKLMALF